MEELVQGLAFVDVVLDGQDAIAKHVCRCPTHDITCYNIIYSGIYMYVYIYMLQVNYMYILCMCI